jgi:hypothetical protein
LGYRRSSFEKEFLSAPINSPSLVANPVLHLRCCQLQKKIDQECAAPRTTRTPTSPDGGEFQKVWIHVSPNDQGSILWRVFMVLKNEPPRLGATDSEEACQIQGNANRAQRRAEEHCHAVPPMPECWCFRPANYQGEYPR